MKTNKAIKNIAKITPALAIILATPIISAACGKKNKDPETDKNKIQPNLQAPVKGKVKYIAIGDDYAIGNNNSDNAEKNNFYDTNTKEVNGLSYASYLANSILLLNDEKTQLESYYNFGLQQSTSSDWLYLLNPDKYSSINFKNMINFNKELGSENQERIKSLFSDFQNYKNNKLLKNIKEANLLTLSIGFNDIYKKDELLSLIFQDYKNEKELKDALVKYRAISLNRIQNLKSNYLNIINEIRNLNKNVNINLTGYISPFLHFLLINSTKEYQNTFNSIILELNNAIQSVAKETKVNYYSFNNEEYILKNPKDFSKDLLNIYPTNNAYKKLAQDIFLKMSISSQDYNKLFNPKKASEHLIALEFDKKASLIKSNIVGLVGLNTDTYKREYQFEKIKKNQEIISSESNNNFMYKLLLEFKTNLLTSDNQLPENIKEVGKTIFNFLNIENENINVWFSNLVDKLIKNNKKQIIINLFNQILSSNNIEKILTKSNFEIIDLINKKSHGNISIKEIKSIFKNNLWEKNNIYKIIKDVLSKGFVSNLENKKLLKEELPSLIKILFSDKIVSKLFPGKLIEIWNKSKEDKEVKEKLNLLINKFVDSGLRNYEKHIEQPDLEGFLNSILKGSRAETITFFKSIINYLIKHEEEFNLISNNLTLSMKEMFSIPDNRLEDINYFIKNIILSLKDFKYNSEFLELHIETAISNKNLKDQNLLKSFVSNLLFNTSNSKLNKNNKVFFALISHKPNIENLDLAKFDRGLQYFAISLIQIENFMSIDKIKNLADEKARDSILKLLKNISINYNNELNERGKTQLKAIAFLLIDEVTQNNSLLNQLLDSLGDYIVIHPLTNYLRKYGLENKILKANPKYKTLEDFVRDGYRNLYNSVNNPIVIEKIKSFVYDVIDNGDRYDQNSIYKFTLSIMARADENGVLDIIKTILKQIAIPKNTDFIANIVNTYMVSYFSFELKPEEITLISSYIEDLLKGIEHSNLYNNFEKYFISTIQKINKSKIDNFEKLGNYLKEELSNFISISTNPDFIQNILELISLKNTNNSEEFNKFLNVITIFLKNENFVDLVIKKINIKDKISNLKNSINVNAFPEEIRNEIKLILSNTLSNVTEKWDDLFLPKLKELIKSSVEKEEIKKAKNINEFISLILSENSLLIKELTEKTLNETLLSSDENQNSIINIIIHYLSQKMNYNNLSEVEKNNLKSFMKKTINFAQNKKLYSPVIDGLFILLESNLKKHGMNFKKYEFTDFTKNIEFKNFDIYQLANEFIDNNLSKDEIKIVIKTALINVPLILSQIIPDKKNEDQSGPKSKIELEKIFAIVTKAINKLSIDDRNELIPYLSDAIFEIKENKNFKKLIIQILKEEIKKIDEAILNKITNQTENSANKLATIIINKVYEHVLEVENKNYFTNILKTILISEQTVDLSPKSIVLKLFKSLKTNKTDEFINKVFDKALNDEEIIITVGNAITLMIEKELNVTFGEQEKNQIADYLKSFMSNLKGKELFNKFKKHVYSFLENQNDLISFKDFKTKLFKNITNFFTLDSKQIKDILNLVLIQNGQNDKENEQKLFKVLKIMLSKKAIIDLAWQKFDINIISNALSNVNLNNLGLNEENKNYLRNIIDGIKNLITAKFDVLIKNNLNELIEKLLLPEVINESNDFESWIKKAFEINQEWLRQKANSIFKEVMDLSEIQPIKNNVAKLLIGLMAQKLNNLNIEDQYKQKMESTTLKLINSISTWEITNEIINSSMNLLIKNLNEHNLNFKEYNFNGLIEIGDIINGLNINKVVEFIDSIESKELFSFVYLFINKFEEFDKLFKLPENSSGNNEQNINKEIVQFKKPISLPAESIFKFIKTSLSVLDSNDRQAIKLLIPSFVEKILASENIKNFAKDKLKFVEKIILESDSQATDFAKETIDKIIKIVFEGSKSKDTFEKLIISAIDLDKNALESIGDINILIKTFFNTNKQSLKDYVKNTFVETLKDNQYINKLLEFVFGQLNKKYKFDSIGDEIKNISSLLIRVINTLENQQQNIITDFGFDFIEKILDANIFILEGTINKETLNKKIISILSNLDYKSIFKPEIFEKIIKSVLSKDLTKETIVTELKSLYSYLTRNIPKLNNENPNDSQNNNEENKQLLLKLESIIQNALIGLNGSIKPSDINAKESVIEVANSIIKDQIKKVNWEALKQTIVPKEDLKKIANIFIEKPAFKQTLNDLIIEILSGSKIANTNTAGEAINKTLAKLSEKLKENIDKIFKELIQDNEIMKIIINSMVEYLKLENVTEDDKQLLKDVVVDIFNDLVKTDYYKKKIIKRTIDHFTNFSKNFSILEPTKWLTDALEKIKLGFGLGDAKIIGEFIGKTKAINGPRLVKLVNLIFGKSNFENSFIYNSLRNINMNENKTKRTTMKDLRKMASINNLNTQPTPPAADDPDNISPDLDPLVLLNSIFSLLWDQYSISDAKNDSLSFKKRSQTEEWKAVYRIQVAMNFAIFEMFGRETLEKQRENGGFTELNLYSGGRAILWELQEATNLKLVPGIASKFSGMQRFFKPTDHLRQFTNYLIEEKKGLFFSSYIFFEEKNYGPESINYIIVSSGYNEGEESKLKNFKYKVTEDGQENAISKKEYILLTLKEGGYGKFMAINNKTSKSIWSGLNKVKEGEFY